MWPTSALFIAELGLATIRSRMYSKVCGEVLAVICSKSGEVIYCAKYLQLSETESEVFVL